MDFRATKEMIIEYWRRQWYGLRNGLGRLAAVSRPLTAGLVLLGIVEGLVPLGVLVALFRTVDAAAGARGVRVQTTDLTEALLTGALLWGIALGVAWLHPRLRGVAEQVATEIRKVTAGASLAGCVFLLMPFRTVGFLIVLAVLLPLPGRTAGALRCVAAVVFGVAAIAGLVGFLLSRSVTVGGFILFVGAAVWLTTEVILGVMRDERRETSVPPRP